MIKCERCGKVHKADPEEIREYLFWYENEIDSNPVETAQNHIAESEGWLEIETDNHLCPECVDELGHEVYDWILEAAEC